jgi:UDP-glucose 4-epimerase
VRDLVHIGDVTGALMAAMDVARAGAAGLSLTLNICSGRAVTVRDLARAAMEATGRDVPLHNGPRRDGDIAQSLGDPALAREVLRFAARTPLEDGMADLARHLAERQRRASSG